MAQKPDRRANQGAVRTRVVEGPRNTWWVWPSVAAGCAAGVVFAYLHLRFGAAAPRAAGTAAANLAIFLGSYLIARRIRPRQQAGTLEALIASLIVAIPVFAIAFVGLGFEIPEMGDFGAMYIAGVWLGSAEAAERAK